MRSSLLAAILVLLAGCGIQIENKYSFADTVDTTAQDTVPEAVDTAQDTEAPPAECNEAWICAYSKCDVIMESYDGNFACINKCYAGLEQKQKTRIEALHDCAKAKCGDTLSGTERTSCIYQYCVSEWATCSNPTGEGSSLCGFIYRDALDNCFKGPTDQAEATCLGTVLKKGSAGGIGGLKKVVPCGPVLFDWAIDPETCVDNLVNCFLNAGEEECGPILKCQTDCFETHCPAKLQQDLGDKCETAKTSTCLVSCLYHMGFDAMDPMKKLGRCMFNASHQAYLEGGANPYTDCLETAATCYGPGGQYYTCKQSVKCLKDQYNFFDDETPANFVPTLLCLEGSTQAAKLLAVIQALAAAFGTAIDPGDLFSDAEKLCE
jgi:hypothetical protein